MLVTESGIVTLVSPLKRENAFVPMLVTPGDMTTFVKESYVSGNTKEILDEHTTCGIVTLVSPLQPSNAYSPMLVTLSGIVTHVSLSQ